LIVSWSKDKGYEWCCAFLVYVGGAVEMWKK